MPHMAYLYIYDERQGGKWYKRNTQHLNRKANMMYICIFLTARP